MPSLTTVTATAEKATCRSIGWVKEVIVETRYRWVFHDLLLILLFYSVGMFMFLLYYVKICLTSVINSF